MMREAFWSYYGLDEKATARLWQFGIVVPDTNVLLNLYRYRPDTRRQLLDLFTAVGDRLWIPHQVALEYQERRIDVIWDMRKPYSDLSSAIDRARDGVLDAVRELPLRLHPVLDIHELEDVVTQGFHNMRSYLEVKEHELPDLFGPNLLTHDEIRDELDGLLTSRVGAGFGAGRLSEIYAEGKVRYEQAVPPGFRDKNDKPEPECYGDLVIWFEILAHAKERELPVLLITDDQKTDWWWISHGQKLGPRHELAEELKAVAGTDLRLYTPDRFMASARERLGLEVSDEAVEEVERASQRKTESALCPHCGTTAVTFLLGFQPGSSAVPFCPSCNHRFHAHRRGNGEILTTRGALGMRTFTSCPECGNEIRVDFSEGDQARERICLSCFANLELRPSGSARVLGYVQVLDAERVSDRVLSCARCGTTHNTFTSYRGSMFALCNIQEPPLLLRWRLPGLVTDSEEARADDSATRQVYVPRTASDP
jgi:hypothetical protein